MYVIETGKIPFAFIAHPKTGSQSVRKSFREQLSAQQVLGHHHVDEPTVGRIKEAGGIVACVVRNPFDLMVSWYFYSNKEPRMGFEEWTCKTIASGNGWIEKGLFYGAHHCNAIIRFEDGLARQLNRILSKCGISNVSLSHEGRTDHDFYRCYYKNEAVIDLVFNTFRKEFMAFDYRWHFML